MSGIKPYIVNTLPTTFSPSGMYFVKGATHADKFKLYLATVDGASVRRLPTADDVTDEIAAAITMLSAIEYAETIAARDLMNPPANTLVYVANATGDATVAVGGATYFYVHATDTFVKVSEAESMDLSITWTALTGKPTSTPAAIDDAVSKAHNTLT